MFSSNHFPIPLIFHFFAVRKKKDNVIKVGRFACFNFKGTLKEKRGNMLKPKLIILGVDRDP